MAAYYTDTFLAKIQPESRVPAGVKLVNAAKYTASATTIVATSTIDFLVIPRGAIILNAFVYADDTTSGCTMDVGLKYTSTCVDSGGTARTAGDVIDADGIFQVLPIGTGPVFGSWQAGVCGATSVLAYGTYIGASAGTPMFYETLADVTLYATINTQPVENAKVIILGVEYIMDYGQDYSTTQA